MELPRASRPLAVNTAGRGARCGANRGRGERAACIAGTAGEGGSIKRAAQPQRLCHVQSDVFHTSPLARNWGGGVFPPHKYRSHEAQHHPLSPSDSPHETACREKEPFATPRDSVTLPPTPPRRNGPNDLTPALYLRLQALSRGVRSPAPIFQGAQNQP